MGTFLTPRRELLGIPDGITGRGVRVALTDVFFPLHAEVAPDGARDIAWLDVDGERFDPASPTAANPRRGQHGLGRAAVCGGRTAGVAPECDMVLLNAGVRDGALVRATDGILDVLVAQAARLGIRAVQLGNKGDLTGPLLPWQWDRQRRVVEQLSAAGVLVVSPTGNCPGSFSPASLAPSALAGGGLALPVEEGGAMEPFHSPAGESFEGRRLPDHLAPAERVVVPALDVVRDCGVPGVPTGWTVDEGTSFSGPFIVGLVACVWQAHPDASAFAVRAAFQRAARSARPTFGPTSVGVPTWAAVEGALAAATARDASPMPFERYSAVQEMDWGQRMAACRRDATDVLLNALPGRAPEALINELTALFHVSEGDRARAALVLLLAPGEGREHPLLDVALDDPSPRVLGCALDVMRRTPALVDGREPAVIRLMDHADGRVRCEALQAAAAAPHRTYVRPLIAGMRRDLEQGPLMAFFLRRLCLKALTGETFWPDTRASLPGECPYSDYWLARQRECMERWERSTCAR